MFEKEKLTEIKRMTIKTAKYGLCFGGGVLLGTLCGFILCLKLIED